MKLLHLTPKDYKVSQWSGGTTTEIFIWPEGASYAARAFSLRISSATVELDESEFTLLPGVMRYIVPMRGSFTLTHPEHSSVAMTPLCAPYRFSGEIATHCVGRATDFNLMLKGVEGEMAICRETAPVLPGLTCLYAPEGSVLRLGDGQYALAEGDSLLIATQSERSAVVMGGPVIRCYAEVSADL